MSRLACKGLWNIIKGKTKQVYGKWTDRPRAALRGYDEELTGRIQLRLVCMMQPRWLCFRSDEVQTLHSIKDGQ